MADSLGPATFDLWSLVPRHNRRLDDTGDLRRFIGCLQVVVDQLLNRVRAMSRDFDLLTARPVAVERTLQELGNPFGEIAPLKDAKRLAAVLVEIYRQKGTGRGIVNALRMFLGLTVLEIRCSNDLRPDEGITVGRAGHRAIYSFDVIFDRPLSVLQRQRAAALVSYMKPVNTHMGDLLPRSSSEEGSHSDE